jgi:hypothetical protein
VKVDTTLLDKRTAEIAQQLIDEQDVDKVKDLTALFNMNAQKKSAVRVMKMNELLDRVTDKVIERFDKTPDNFSNDDLIKYMQVTETAIEKASKNLNQVSETPPITLTQNNQVNINVVDALGVDSRKRVTEAVQEFLRQTAQMQNAETIEILDEEEDTDDNE